MQKDFFASILLVTGLLNRYGPYQPTPLALTSAIWSLISGLPSTSFSSSRFLPTVLGLAPCARQLPSKSYTKMYRSRSLNAPFGWSVNVLYALSGPADLISATAFVTISCASASLACSASVG